MKWSERKQKPLPGWLSGLRRRCGKALEVILEVGSAVADDADVAGRPDRQQRIAVDRASGRGEPRDRIRAVVGGAEQPRFSAVTVANTTERSGGSMAWRRVLVTATLAVAPSGTARNPGAPRPVRVSQSPGRRAQRSCGRPRASSSLRSRRAWRCRPRSRRLGAGRGCGRARRPRRRPQAPSGRRSRRAVGAAVISTSGTSCGRRARCRASSRSRNTRTRGTQAPCPPAAGRACDRRTRPRRAARRWRGRPPRWWPRRPRECAHPAPAPLRPRGRPVAARPRPVTAGRRLAVASLTS